MNLTEPNRERADKTIIVFCQHQRYQEEITRLGKTSPSAWKGLNRKSAIYRAGGQSKATIPDEAKHPMNSLDMPGEIMYSTQEKILDHECQLCSAHSYTQMCGVGSSMPTVAHTVIPRCVVLEERSENKR